MLIAVCNAIAFAHDRGIVHRDLKPENVMIGDYGEVVLLDWGLAVCIGSTDDPRAPTLGKHPSVAGTPAYLAPEMLGAPGEIDARTDIFLLGAVLFEVVTGRPPHRGDSLDALLADAATPVEIPRSVPAALRTICARAMAFDPADRYPSAGSFRDAIERYLMHERSTSIAARAETAAMRFREQDAEGYAPDAPEVTIPFERARRELHAALELWPANEAARSALGALVALRAARYLEVDEPHRAATLLRELDEPPPALAVQIDAALAREEEERAVGQAIRSSRDNASGRAIRVRAALAFGALWTLSPLLGARLVGDSPFLVPGLPLLYLSVAAVMSVRLQRIIRADHFNRILFGVVALVLVAEALLGASGVALGVATSATAVLLFSLRMLAAGFIGLVVHHRFFWVASIYALGMVLSVVWHGAEPYLTAGCNAFAALTAAGGWIVDARFTAANRPAVGTEAGEGFPYG